MLGNPTLYVDPQRSSCPCESVLSADAPSGSPLAPAGLQGFLTCRLGQGLALFGKRLPPL